MILHVTVGEKKKKREKLKVQTPHRSSADEGTVSKKCFCRNVVEIYLKYVAISQATSAVSLVLCNIALIDRERERGRHLLPGSRGCKATSHTNNTKNITDEYTPAKLLRAGRCRALPQYHSRAEAPGVILRHAHDPAERVRNRPLIHVA